MQPHYTILTEHEASFAAVVRADAVADPWGTVEDLFSLLGNNLLEQSLHPMVGCVLKDE